jgi:hypothetical protein
VILVRVDYHSLARLRVIHRCSRILRCPKGTASGTLGEDRRAVRCPVKALTGAGEKEQRKAEDEALKNMAIYNMDMTHDDRNKT